MGKKICKLNGSRSRLLDVKSFVLLFQMKEGNEYAFQCLFSARKTSAQFSL